MSRNRTKEGFPLDRLSNIPSSVLGEILKLLPLCDVVRTSILSREWRYKWVACPHLVFDDEFRNRLSKHHKPELVIYRMLVLHKEPIVMFIYHGMPKITSADVDCWLHLLSNRNVEDFTLAMDYVIPRHFYNFDNLTCLTLFKVKLRTPLDFKGFNKHVELHLEVIKSKPDCLGRFLSKCPVLESLTIVDGKWDERPFCFNIEAPHLKLFKFLGLPCLLQLHSPNLHELSLDYTPYHDDLDESSLVKVGKGNLIRVFGELPSIKRLRLDNFLIQLIARAGIPQEQENVNDLTDLTLEPIIFVRTDVVTLTLCLIKSSPNLQRLNIRFNNDEYLYDEYDTTEYMEAIEYVKAQQKCEVALKHLISVDIEDFADLRSVMEFLKLLLQWATRLEKLEIRCVSEITTERKLNVLKEFATFPRMSHFVLIFE